MKITIYIFIPMTRLNNIFTKTWRPKAQQNSWWRIVEKACWNATTGIPCFCHVRWSFTRPSWLKDRRQDLWSRTAPFSRNQPRAVFIGYWIILYSHLKIFINISVYFNHICVIIFHWLHPLHIFIYFIIINTRKSLHWRKLPCLLSPDDCWSYRQ